MEERRQKFQHHGFLLHNKLQPIVGVYRFSLKGKRCIYLKMSSAAVVFAL